MGFEPCFEGIALLFGQVTKRVVDLPVTISQAIGIAPEFDVRVVDHWLRNEARSCRELRICIVAGEALGVGSTVSRVY